MKLTVLFALLGLGLSAQAQLTDAEKTEMDQICECAEEELDDVRDVMDLIAKVYDEHGKESTFSKLMESLTEEERSLFMTKGPQIAEIIETNIATCMGEPEQLSSAFDDADYERISDMAEYLEEEGCDNSSVFLKTLAFIRVNDN